MGRQDVQLPAIQALVGVEQEAELPVVQAPVRVQQEEDTEDPEAEEEELADVREDVELAAVQALVGVEQVENAEDPGGVEVFGFNIPEGMRVDEGRTRSQLVRRTLSNYKNCDASGGDGDLTPVYKKKLSPRDRKRRCTDTRRRTKGGTPAVPEEEEGDQT